MLDSIGSTYANFTAGMVAPRLTGSCFWLHCAAAVLFTFGFTLTIRKGAWKAKGLDRIIAFGPLFFAAPLAVFGMQHFSALNIVVDGVPSWMPWHLFWVCLVGIALIAASLSIITGVKAELAVLLVGIMLFLFVLLIYVPNTVRNPGDRFAVALMFRDLSLSGGALALAGTLAGGRWDGAHWIAVLGRHFFAIPMAFFGVEHFLHPDFAPGVPLEQMMPPWMPGHMFWAYLTGAVLVISSLSMLLNRREHYWGARFWATALGVLFLVLVLFIYMPMEIVHPSIEISGELDYVADTLAMSGAALLVAGALKRKTA